ncbi:hypothetical protein KBD87_01765 [Candidatus Saccharibacteria bacterium]|nr:hypothetical protein [Candidatus Saccharibacteria bacterium]
MRIEDLERALNVTKIAVETAGDELRQHYGNVEPEAKGSGDGVAGVVTELDRKIERYLAEELGKFDEGIGFLGEESGGEPKPTTWLVDPIDGTAHFIRGIPFCTTMVALIEDNQVVMSVIHDIANNDTYWAIRGQGAYRNGERIYVSDRPLKQGLVSFETKLGKPENQDAYLKLSKLTTILATVNSGFEFIMIASGKLDGRIGVDPYGMDWDFAPGSLLVEEAGGIVRNIGSDTYDYHNHDYLAVNPVIYEELTSGNEALFRQ